VPALSVTTAVSMRLTFSFFNCVADGFRGQGVGEAMLRALQTLTGLAAVA
jgi:hypothetical protein